MRSDSHYRSNMPSPPACPPILQSCHVRFMCFRSMCPFLCHIFLLPVPPRASIICAPMLVRVPTLHVFTCAGSAPEKSSASFTGARFAPRPPPTDVPATAGAPRPPSVDAASYSVVTHAVSDPSKAGIVYGGCLVPRPPSVEAGAWAVGTSCLCVLMCTQCAPASLRKAPMRSCMLQLPTTVRLWHPHRGSCIHTHTHLKRCSTCLPQVHLSHPHRGCCIHTHLKWCSTCLPQGLLSYPHCGSCIHTQLIKAVLHCLPQVLLWHPHCGSCIHTQLIKAVQLPTASALIAPTSWQLHTHTVIAVLHCLPQVRLSHPHRSSCT